MTTEQVIPHWTLGERLAKARKDAGLTQTDMARLFERSSKTISAWEVLRRQPRDFFHVLETWAEITHVPLWWLIDLEERPSGCEDVSAGQTLHALSAA